MPIVFFTFRKRFMQRHDTHVGVYGVENNPHANSGNTAPKKEVPVTLGVRTSQV